MNGAVSDWLNLIFRWIHVAAGIMWIGHLYFFNFVNSQVAKTYSADAKKAVVPELMPRALYWFRWGAAYTWVTGILLLGVVYYMGGGLGSSLGDGVGALVGLALLIVGFIVYDLLWKSPLGKNEKAGAAVSFLLLALVAFGMSRIFGGRAVFIHIGAILGTIMAANVWMRIWPNQRKIIAATKAGTPPDAALVAAAGLRSKHNTYMSVPLVLMMVSNHYPTVYGHEFGWAIASVLVLVGWAMAKFLFTKAPTPAPAKF